MKRALAILAVCSLFGFVGFGQLSGTWEGEILLIGTGAPSLTSTTLTLNYMFNGWTLTSISGFDSTGFVSQEFEASGAFGPLTVSGDMVFDPGVPAYVSTDLDASLEFGGVTFDLGISHGMPGSDLYNDYCQTGSAAMLYTIGLEVSPVAVEVNFLDCCEGIEFYDATLTLSDLSICCGIAYDLEVYFTKEVGFEYALITIDPLVSLCCGISFGVEIKYGVDYKSVTPIFTWEGVTGCVTLWGDLQEKDEPEVGIEGLEFYAFKIYCELAECNYVEFVTAFDPEWYNDNVEDVFEEAEFEYIELGFCGPGCCGGQWSSTFAAYFQESGGLFGITRFTGEVTVPVMSNFSFTVSFASTPELSVGWTFTF